MISATVMAAGGRARRVAALGAAMRDQQPRLGERLQHLADGGEGQAGRLGELPRVAGGARRAPREVREQHDAVVRELADAEHRGFRRLADLRTILDRIGPVNSRTPAAMPGSRAAPPGGGIQASRSVSRARGRSTPWPSWHQPSGGACSAPRGQMREAPRAAAPRASSPAGRRTRPPRRRRAGARRAARAARAPARSPDGLHAHEAMERSGARRRVGLAHHRPGWRRVQRRAAAGGRAQLRRGALVSDRRGRLGADLAARQLRLDALRARRRGPRRRAVRRPRSPATRSDTGERQPS